MNTVNDQKTFLIIPTYNEEKHIGQVLETATQVVKNIIVVDDASRDRTYEIARSFPIVVLRHQVNLGKAAALLTGCEAARRLKGETVVFMDADGQHKAQDIPEFLKLIGEGYDMVVGVRTGGDRAPIVRNVGNKLVAYAIRLLFGIYSKDVQSGFRAFRVKNFDKLRWFSSRYHADAELTARTGFFKLRYAEVPIQTIYHDATKGMTAIDGLKLLVNVFLWRIRLW